MNDKRCLYYEEFPVKSCSAVLHGIKVPSKREIEWFCLGGHYEECLTFIEREREVKNFYKRSSQTGKF